MEKKDHQKDDSGESVANLIEDYCGRWFIPIVGFVYACGFLVVFTFFKGYGITDISFVEAKYIHVGSFFLFACIVIILPLVWIPYLRDPKYPHNTIPTILGATLMLLVLFAVLAFASRGFYHTYPFAMFLNFLIPVLLLASGWITDSASNTEKNDTTKWNKAYVMTFQWALLIIQSVVVVYTFRHLDNFIEMWTKEPVCIAFIGLMVLIVLYGKRLLYRLPQAQSRGQQLNLIISNGCIIGLFAYLAIWSFARSVYPFIPASKGGGNFAMETPIHLTFKSDFTKLVPPQVTNSDSANHLILLEESNGFLFVADNTAMDGAANWQGTNKPPVYEIALDTIMTIVHDNTNSMALQSTNSQ